MRTGRRTRYGARYGTYRPPTPPPRGGRQRGRPIGPGPVVAAAVVVLLVAAGLGIASLSGAFGGGGGDRPAGGAASGTMEPGSRFAEGVVVDGADVSKLTIEEAKPKVEQAQQARLKDVSVTLVNGNYKVPFTAEQVSVSFGTDETLAEAMIAGKAGEYASAMSVDPSAIEQDVRQYAEILYVAPVDSIATRFYPERPDGQRFDFSDDRPGKKVDGDALWAKVKQVFATGSWGPLEVVPEPVPAAVTKANLQANCKLVASFYSIMRTSKDRSKERLKNITLAAATVTNRVIPPGGEFSFNGTTSERTADKGYQIAHVINAGVEDNGLGGGVCQVSGTLFNAAARAGLQIAKRTPHTFPSTYLEKGQDATVDFPRKDLVIRNNGETPVIIVMRVDEKDPWHVTAEIYGKPFPAGESLELKSVVKRKIPALVDANIRYEDSQAVQPGETKVVQPKDGWEIIVYLLHMKNGVEVSREEFDRVTYQATGTVVLYNPADPKPSGLPTPTPSATPGPTPPPQQNTPAPETPPPSGTAPA